MPRRRPFSFDAIGSRLSSPSGSSPVAVRQATLSLAAVEKELDPMEFSSFYSGSCVQNVGVWGVIFNFVNASIVICACAA
jgi:hypothetical protein